MSREPYETYLKRVTATVGKDTKRMKFNIKLAAEAIEKEPGVEKVINESTKFEDADPQRIASELEMLERSGFEVTVTATAKEPKSK